MANFFEELWLSIFTPGASPQLVLATHVSFLFLTACLGWLIFWTKNIHFIMLLVISTLLWITVTWFVSELKQAQIKDNEELAKAQKDPPEKANTAAPEASGDQKTEATAPNSSHAGQSSSLKQNTTKSRKL